MNMMKLLVNTNHHGLENIERDEVWSVDLDTGDCLPARGPENEKPFLDKFKELGCHWFLLGRRGDGIFIPVTGPIRIWNVNNLPSSLNKFFEMVPEGVEGIEFTGYDFDPKNYSLLLLKNLTKGETLCTK